MRVIQDGQKLAMCEAEGCHIHNQQQPQDRYHDKTAEYFGKNLLERASVRQYQSWFRIRRSYVPKNDFNKFMPEGDIPKKCH
jgi:hypothetical protein